MAALFCVTVQSRVCSADLGLLLPNLRLVENQGITGLNRVKMLDEGAG
jgi:hypothetical protein